LGNYYGWCVYDYRGGAEMNIIELARQAGVRDDGYIFEFSEYKYLERFAKLVAAHEREECAKLCDDGYFAFIAADIIRERETT